MRYVKLASETDADWGRCVTGFRSAQKCRFSFAFYDRRVCDQRDKTITTYSVISDDSRRRVVPPTPRRSLSLNPFYGPSQFVPLGNNCVGDDTKSPALRQVLPRSEWLNKFHRRQTDGLTNKQTGGRHHCVKSPHFERGPNNSASHYLLCYTGYRTCSQCIDIS